MTTYNSDNITQNLNRWIMGQLVHENELLEQLYPLLRNVAYSQLNKASDSCLNPTLIVNEAYLKLRQKNKIQVVNKNHFLALSARIIRRIILDDLRVNSAAKRGGEWVQVTLCEFVEGQRPQAELQFDWFVLNDLLDELEKVDSESLRIIELRFFAGLTIDETAEVCMKSPSSISRSWRFARTWLLDKLQEKSPS
jgi:RNA polymerase sigma factor (TIGR02999 family)